MSTSDESPLSDDEAFIARLWQLGPSIADAPPHSKRLGIRFLSVDKRRASMALDYSPDLIGDKRTRVLHGGPVTTLLDQTSGLCAMASFLKPISVATLNLHIDYQRAATPGETLIAVAECYKLTRHIAFIRGIAHHGDETDPVATCQASFMATSRTKAPSSEDE